MLTKISKFVCLNCYTECCHDFLNNCKHVSIDAQKKNVECDGNKLVCERCKNSLIVPVETKKYKITIECEYSLDISPVENDVVHSEHDGTTEEILNNIIHDSLYSGVDSYTLSKIVEVK